MQKTQSEEERRRFAEQLFKYYDKDHSGYLELEEMVPLINDVLDNMKAGYKANQGEVLAIMKIIDSNGDRRISQQQFWKVLEDLLKLHK